TPTKSLYALDNTNTFGNNAIYVASRGGTTRYDAETIDELRIYNRALSATEIQQVYGATLASIAVAPANASITAGKTQQYTATGTYTDGTTQNLTSSVTWTSTSTGVASISASGLASGVA